MPVSSPPTINDVSTSAPASERITVPSLTGRLYFPVAFFARFPFAMMVVGTLTLIVAARDSIALGGLNSAIVGLGGAIGGPIIGAAADRFGQRPVILIAGTTNGLFLVLLAWVAYSSAPDSAVLAVSFVTGASAAQAGPLSRSRLVQIIARRMPQTQQVRAVERTMAYESAADEVTFVFGPVLVGVLATIWGAAAAMIGAAAVSAIFVTAFALHHTSNFDQHDRASASRPVAAPVRDLFSAKLLILVAGSLMMGLVFGATLTSLIAFMDDRGNSDAAGLIYGILGVGSAILALACAVFPSWFTQGARWLVFASLLVIGSIIFGIADTLSGIIIGIAILGLGAGPTLVTLFSLTAERAPHGRYSTAMTMVGSAITVGQAVAAAVTGQVAATFTTAASLWAPLLSGVAVLVVGAVNAGVYGVRRFARV